MLVTLTGNPAVKKSKNYTISHCQQKLIFDLPLCERNNSNIKKTEKEGGEIVSTSFVLSRNTHGLCMALHKRVTARRLGNRDFQYGANVYFTLSFEHFVSNEISTSVVVCCLYHFSICAITFK